MNDFFDQALRPPAPLPLADSTSAPAPAGADSSASPTPGTADSSPPSQPDQPSTPATPAALKSAIQDLLRCGLVERDAKPNLYRILCAESPAVARILEPLDLVLRIDEVRGLAFLVVPDHAAENAEEAWQHPLVRRQRLTTEQSLLIAILRQGHIAYEQQNGIGAAGAHADLDDLLPQFNLYLGDTGSESRNLDRLLRVLAQLQAHGIVSEPDKDQRVAIRPIIVHLANPEHLQLLIHHFKKTAALAPKNPDAPASDPATDADPAPSS